MMPAGVSGISISFTVQVKVVRHWKGPCASAATCTSEPQPGRALICSRPSSTATSAPRAGEVAPRSCSVREACEAGEEKLVEYSAEVQVAPGTGAARLAQGRPHTRGGSFHASPLQELVVAPDTCAKPVWQAWMQTAPRGAPAAQLEPGSCAALVALRAGQLLLANTFTSLSVTRCPKGTTMVR